MTPKVKAESLVRKFYLETAFRRKGWLSAKICATNAANEVIETLLCFTFEPAGPPNGNIATLGYWSEVKEEIEKL